MRSGASCLINKTFEQEVSAFRTLLLQYRFERVEPFLGFHRVYIRGFGSGIRFFKR